MRFLAWVLTAAIANAFVGGCSYPIQRSIDPADVEESAGKRVVGATMKSGEQLKFKPSGYIQGDSLLAEVDGTTLRIAMQDVEEVVVEEMHQDRVVEVMCLLILVGGVTLLVYGLQPAPNGL